MILTDEEVVVKVRNGNKELFGVLIGRYEKKLHGYIRNLINQSREEVEDLVQETLVRAYENLRDFEAKRKFSSWIFRIGHNLSVDWMKKKRAVTLREKDGTEDDDDWLENMADKSESIEAALINREKRQELRNKIGALGVKYREVVLLHYYENKSYEEISDILRIPVGNVGVMLFRAKEKLRQAFDL